MMDMQNTREELIEHLTEEAVNREVKYIHIQIVDEDRKNLRIISGTLREVLPLLDFEYNNRFGEQELFGNIWYTDGTWSARGVCDGVEWWEFKVCPDIPKEIK